MRVGSGTVSLFILILAAAVSGCQSKPVVAGCEQRDWFELGRTDGAQGTSENKLKKYAMECPKQFRSEWETMYTNGRNAGLNEYCSPENAYELGRSGQTYLYVCPSTMEPQFLGDYRRGQRARELEIANKHVRQKSESEQDKPKQFSKSQ